MNDNYSLELDENKKTATWKSIKELFSFLGRDKLKLLIAMLSVLLNSALSIYAPLLIGNIVDEVIVSGNKDELGASTLRLLVVYLVIAACTYLQIYLMGRVGQNILYKLRDAIFRKIQNLPLSFFNQNRAGDLISRINNDTEKLNQAFSEVLLRFIGGTFVIIGIGIYMVILNPKLGLITLSACAVLLTITQILSPIIQRQNKKAFEKFGDLSAEVSESINNFRVIVAFNRRKYFRDNFIKVNNQNYKISTKTSFLNALLQPIYDFGSNIALLIVIIAGITLLISGEITIGLLITFIAYTNTFYQPLKIMASLFASIQASLAAWSRVSEILSLQSNLKIIEHKQKANTDSKHLLEFKGVSFKYSDSNNVLNKISFTLDVGKTYALVGPTGGGKTTTASLMARLYDPSEGVVLFKGRDIRTYKPEEISSEIGFILQEPILFTGTIAENIKYGNEKIFDMSNEELTQRLKELNLDKVVNRFKEGLDTNISQSGNGISLGQKQLIAFLRILLREPKLLILDEATANIDTVTEELLQEIQDKMPKDTTKVIIAHRLNTIEKADEIFFIANGEMQKTMSFKDAISMIEKTKRQS